MSDYKCIILGSLLTAAFALPSAVLADFSPSPPIEYTVQVNATVQETPPSVTLAWATTGSSRTTSYTIKRRVWTEIDPWTTLVTGLPKATTSWTDPNVIAGTTYEYQIIRVGGGDDGTGTGGSSDSYGYVSAAIKRPLVDSRGTVLLLVDNSQVAALGPDLSTFQADLINDGWKVTRIDVNRSAWEKASNHYPLPELDKDAVPAIKAQIVAAYNADPTISHLLILGHVPIPRSGWGGGANQHFSSVTTADNYYADISGVWTDTTVNQQPTSGENLGEVNLPGDGRFDQNRIPGTGPLLAVGRVDFFDLPAYAPLSETDLLRRYLAKEHAWRTGQWQVQTKTFMSDQLGVLYWGAASPSVSGWQTTSVVGAGNVVKAPFDAVGTPWFPATSNASYLFGLGEGVGYPGGCAGVAWPGGGDRSGQGSTSDSGSRVFARYKCLSLFNRMWGSGFGMWDQRDAFMRAVIANDGYTLTDIYAESVYPAVHRMALGATIGETIQVVQKSSSFSHWVTPPFTVTAGNHTISFAATSTADQVSLLDNVAINSSVPGVTVPVVNPSFETPVLAAGGASIRPAGAGWTFLATGESGIERNGSWLSSINNNGPYTANGSQAAYLRGLHLSNTTPGVISQTINFPAGTYTLSFNLAPNANNIQPVQVSVDGVPVGQPITPDKRGNYFVAPDYFSNREAYISLMGDPTLRVHPIAPPVAPRVTVSASSITLQWNASPAPGVIGYHIYRASSPDGPFTRVSGSPADAANPSGTPVTGTSFADTGVPAGSYVYQIKAVKLETTPGGTYYNTSLGSNVSVTTSGNSLSITGQPRDAFVAVGATATFIVTASGSPSPAYQWLKNGVAITGATSASYTTPPAFLPADEGVNYSVAVTNSLGAVYSNPARLSVMGFTIQPFDVATTVGKSAFFPSAAGGLPPPTFQWYKNGNPISGATMPGYTIQSAAAADNNTRFHVTATYPGGVTVTSRAVTLTVNAPTASLSFDLQPGPTSASVGQTATFTAHAIGTTVLTYQWQKNGANISGATSASYTTPPVVLADQAAFFQCVATNASGSATSNAVQLSVRSNIPVFVADFNGAGNGNGGPLDIVSSGGTATVQGSANYNLSVQGASPFSTGSGKYLKCVWTGAAGTATYATLSPATPANSFASFVGPTVVNGTNTYRSLNGGYDIFVRLNNNTWDAPNPTDFRTAQFFPAFNVSNKTGTQTGLGFWMYGVTWGGIWMNITSGSNPNTGVNSSALTNLTYVGTTNPIETHPLWLHPTTRASQFLRSGDAPGGGTYRWGDIYHYAFTFSTDAAGLITWKMFGVQSGAAIDTTSNANLQSATTFNLDAAIAGPNPINSGPFPLTGFAGLPGTDVDIDSLRIFNSDPGIFPALGAPTITAQPQSITVPSGQTATFRVTATGGTSYQWKKNGINISGATAANYTTPATVGADNGSTFSVVVTNSDGSVISGIAVLTVTISPDDLSIATQPQGTTVFVGQPATFTVAATGSSAIGYQWRKNGAAIPGATSASYTLPSAALSDSGASYSVLLTNAAGSMASNAAALTVYAVPVFQADFNGSGTGTGGPGNLVTLGGTASLFSGANATTSVETSLPLVPGELGYLHINDTGSGGTAGVTFHPSSAAQSLDSLYVDGGAATFDRLNGGFDFFFRDTVGSALWTGGADFRPLDTNGGNSGMRIIINSLGADRLQVELVGFNAAGTKVQDILAGGAATVTANALYHLAVMASTDAAGIVTLKLFLAPGNTPINTASNIWLIASGTSSGVFDPSGTNAITHAFYPAAGFWLGMGYSNGADAKNLDFDSFRIYNANPLVFPALSGATAPTIATQPQNATVISGQNATFTVAANGTPAPTYQWQKNGSAISGATSASYTTPVTVGGDNGAAFRVVVTNSAGSVTSGAATLTVLQTFSQWQAFYGISGGASATSRNDGVSNLLKYLCHINPSLPMSATDRAALPALGMTNSGATRYLTLTYRRNALATGVTVTLQTSSDLNSWQTVTPDIDQQVGVDSITGDPILIVGVDVTGLARKFIRLNIILP